jgi:Cu(I)/Ag(I) efflux system membrane protein CusA/SilA
MQDRILRTFPEVETVFGKVGRAETATDPAPITMVETTVRLRPQEQWRPGMTWEKLTAEMNRKMQFPGWTNAWTMPIKTRVDMLTTGVRTPIGVKVFGTDLDEIEKIGTALEHTLAPIEGTRSVLYERSLGGLYLDIVPRPEALARYGLQVGDVEDVIEGAVGGLPIGVTVEGRNRFSINVRYPQDLRDDLEQLRRVLVPIGGGASPKGAGSAGMGTQGSLERPPGSTGIVLAQAMGEMEGRAGGGGPPRLRLPDNRPMSDAAGPGTMGGGMTGGGAAPDEAMGAPAPGMAGGAAGAGATAAPGTPGPVTGRGFVPLGELADIHIAGGPPMVRDEAGLLVGYVYVDIDQGRRDIGGYVDEAKAVVARAMAAGELTLPPGYYLKWTGQYEQLAEMVARMKVVLPVTLLIIVLLLFLQFRNVAQVLIILLSIPFALIGSVWLMWLLDYRLSTAVWVGIIALTGLAAQTGIVMMVYIDHAFEARRREGRIRDLGDIIAAHMEGTVQRVRPKLMTVSTMLIGLAPLLWAESSGADVMKRIAAPMVGGLLTSAFLTLEIIPVVVTYWRREQLLWQQLAARSPALLRQLAVATAVLAAGLAVAAGVSFATIYVALPARLVAAALVVGSAAFLAGAAAYLVRHSAAHQVVWPPAPHPPLSPHRGESDS